MHGAIHTLATCTFILSSKSIRNNLREVLLGVGGLELFVVLALGKDE